MPARFSALVVGLLLFVQSPSHAGPPAPAREAISFSVAAAGQELLALRKVEALRERIRRHGEALVVLELRSMGNERPVDGAAPPSSEVTAEIAAFRQHMHATARDQFRIKREMPYLPMVSIHLREPALDAILSSRLVHKVHAVQPLRLGLAETTVQVRATASHQAGYMGTGTAIAVIDTGVARYHPFLVGKVVHEQCFGTQGTIGAHTSWSNCPGFAESASGPGSAEPCLHANCDHGTQVAGVAAGALAGTENRGVAPGANIIAIQAYSLVDTPAGTTEILAWPDDLVMAMQHVYSLRNNHTIAAANLSWDGPDLYDDYCDADSMFTSTIQLLRGAGILSVISAGNRSSSTGMYDPACVSGAISVGSVGDTDVVSGFSNAAEMLDLFAPGESVATSGLDSDNSTPIYESVSGTSLAAPHVAGAIAILRAQQPSRTPNQIESRLKAVGPLITDARNGGGVTRRRLDVLAAVQMPERPLLQAAFSRCDGPSSVYGITWREGNGAAVTTWDVDLSQNGSSWSDWYNGAGEAKSLTFDGGSRHLRARGYNSIGWGEFASISVADVCNPPPAPVVRKEFIQCNSGYAVYQISWDPAGNTPVSDWDVDIASTGSGPWSAWYDGTQRSRQISFDGGTRYFRVRGNGVSGWSPFSTISALDSCTGTGPGPQPESGNTLR